MFTPIQLDKMRNLRYAMKAISLIEKQFGKNFFNIQFDDLSMEQLATIIWAGLVHEDAELTVESVMDLIDAHSSISKVTFAMNEAFETSFGTNEEGK